MKVLINAFVKSRKCVFWKVKCMSWLLWVMSVTPKEVRRVMLKPCTVALVYVETCDFDLYSGYLWSKRFQELYFMFWFVLILPWRRWFLGNGPTVYGKMGLFVGQSIWFQEDWLKFSQACSSWVPSFTGVSHPGEGCKAATLHRAFRGWSAAPSL